MKSTPLSPSIAKTLLLASQWILSMHEALEEKETIEDLVSLLITFPCPRDMALDTKTPEGKIRLGAVTTMANMAAKKLMEILTKAGRN